MTSKISFSKLIRIEGKQCIWMTAVQAVVFGLLIPFRVLLVMSANQSRGMSGYPADVMDLLNRQLGFSRWENVPVILFFGIVCAIASFSYLHSQVKLDLYHSLPVKREKLFWAKYVTSVLSFAIPYGISQLLGLLFGALYGGVTLQLAAEVVASTLLGILFFLVSYAAALVAIVLTGKILTSVLAIGVFGCYIPMLLLLWCGYAETFLVTALNGELSVLDEMLPYTSPWAFCMFWGRGAEVSTRTGLTGRWPSPAGICQLITLIALLSLLALALYRRRRTEAAGNALAFAWMEPVIKILLVVPMTLLVLLACHVTLTSLLWDLILLLLFGILFCVLVELIYRWDVRQALMHKGQMAAALLLTALVFFGLRFDLTGFNKYLPKPEELAGMSVLEYNYYQYDPYGNNEYRVSVEKQNLTRVESDQIEVLYALAEMGVQRAAEDLHGNRSYTEDQTWIDLKYHLKNGREVYRTYCVDKAFFEQQISILLEDPAYKELYFPILGWKAEDLGFVEYEGMSFFRVEDSAAQSDAEGETELSEDQEYGTEYAEETREWANGEYEWLSSQIPVKWKEELLEAYQQDLAELTYAQISGFDSDRLLFQLKEDQNISRRYAYPVNSNFKRTAELLRKLL